ERSHVARAVWNECFVAFKWWQALRCEMMRSQRDRIHRDSREKLQPPCRKPRHAQQQPAMFPARDVRLAVSARVVADRQIDDPRVQFRRAKQQVEIAERIEVAEISAI